MNKDKLLHITAYEPSTETRVDLYFNSIKEAKLKNPSLWDFREVSFEK